MNKLFVKYLTLGLSLAFIITATLFYLQKEHIPPMKQDLVTNATALNYTGALPISIGDIVTAASPNISEMAAVVTSQALKAFSGSDYSPLPLMAHWDIGEADAMNPTYMLSRLEKGEHVLVSWELDPYYSNTIGNAYYEESIKKAAELQLPLVFILPAPESALTKDSYYKTLAKSENPNVVDMQGNVLDRLSPFGPNNLWNEIGEQWTSTALMTQIQEWYPNPPLVLFINKDRASRLYWSDIDTSSRYMKNYPQDKNDAYKRTLIGAQWIEKYRQMHIGFKQGLTQESWKNNIKFISYDDFSDDLGQISTWLINSTLTKQYLDISPLAGDGTSVSFDLTKDMDYANINAPQIALNNLPFMLQEAKRNNPNFIQQLSITHNSNMTDPALYRGLTQFGLWFLRPSIIRQNSPNSMLEEMEPLFNEMSDSVELIYNSDILSDFWKNGKLVSNGESNFNRNIPAQYKDDPRWFLLDVDANPTRPWTESSSIKVWAFALVKGESPNREWLIYAQSPENNMSNITINIPNYKDILLEDSSINGNFYLSLENNSTSTTQVKNIISSPPIIPTTRIVDPSIYLEEINIPVYDANNDTHILITPSNANWNSSALNNPHIKHFYIQAGDYSGNRIVLNTSGTEEEVRTISLHDPDNPTSSVHPSKLLIEEQANISLTFDNANYWIINRLSNINDHSYGSFIFTNQSTNNILNQIHIKDYYYGILIKNLCHNNTIQNSYLNHMTHEGRVNDNVGIAINTNIEGAKVFGTKILNNDIRNAGDGIQTVKNSGIIDVYYNNTIIDSNRIWIDGQAYTNGNYKNYGYNATGFYMIAENAIDLKVGSSHYNEPLIITNNIIYGYQESDTTASASISAGMGTAVVAHFGIYNVLFNNNVIFDSQSALAISSPAPMPYAASNWSIQNNIFANLNIVNPQDKETYGVFIYNSEKIIFENNLFYNVKSNSSNQGSFFKFYNVGYGNTYKNNIAILSDGTSYPSYHDDPILNDNVSIIDIENNYFYDSIEYLNGTKNHNYKTIDEANMDSLDLEIKQLQNISKKTIPMVKTTILSPHYK